MKKLTKDGPAIVRVMQVALVISCRENSSVVDKKLEEEKKKAKDKVRKLETALGVVKEKMKNKEDELSSKLEEEKSWMSEKKKLEEDLRVISTPADDKSDDLKVLKYRVEFVAGFETAVTQLEVLNPRLNTEGIGILTQVVDGRLVLASPDSPLYDEEVHDGKHEE